MKRQDKPVIVEVKRSGRKTFVKANATSRTSRRVDFASDDVATTMPEASAPTSATVGSSAGGGADAARRAADLLFAPRLETASARDGAVAQADAQAQPARRVLPSLVEPIVAAPLDAAAPDERDAKPAARRGRPPGSRNVKTAAVAAGVSPGSQVALDALDMINRLDTRTPARGAAGAKTQDLVEQRRSAATPLVPVPKRRGRPPKVAAEPSDGATTERVWTSSKIFASDDADDAAPVSRPLPAAPKATQPVATSRSSFRMRASEYKPGERWKRRLRGHAR